MGSVHSGLHTLGAPEQPVEPEASKASIAPWSELLAKTTPLATVGVVVEKSPMAARHNGLHTVGVPEHFIEPAASNAYRLPLPEAT